MGNICRSPLAEGVFEHLAAHDGLSDRFQAESGAVGAWHVGEDYDARTRRVARAHGLRLDGKAKQFRPGDFARFDHVFALDEDIAYSLRRLARTDADRAKIQLLRVYDPLADGNLNVPDPYYDGMEEFESVYQMTARACRALLDALKADA
jgi:protein-tyrosine phosphatase